MRLRFLAVALHVLLVVLLVPGIALAHGDVEGEAPGPGTVAEPGHAEGEGVQGGLEIPDLEIALPEEAGLGETITIRATLTDPHDGTPIVGALVLFQTLESWSEEFQGHALIGSATTDRRGTATIRTELRSSGDVEIAAAFQGSGGFGPTESSQTVDVHGDAQLYEQTTGLHIPGLNLWVLAGVIALVWSVYFLVGLRVLAIARPRPRGEQIPAGVPGGTTRRQFLARALPLGAQAGVAAAGVGLVALVVRSPRTHGNLLAPPATANYQRTPVARIGQTMEMRVMPEPLDREVRFSRDVLPIFLANGGPHVVTPEHSPPPGRLRLDSYEGVMAKEGVVVSGEPEKSELVEHLLSAGMQMPPSLPPLPDEQIQLIVTWIAQGARDN